jgi:hypothetical protein
MVVEHHKRQGKVTKVSLRYSLQFPLMHAPYQIESSPLVDEVHTMAVTAVEKVLI